MSENEKNESKKPGLWDVSPLSPQWTTACVFVLILFFTASMFIGLN